MISTDLERRRNWGNQVGVAGLAMVAAVGTFLATRHGPALSADSVTYLSVARNILSGQGYTDFTGQAVTTFAPGFPVLLAAGHWTGLSLLTTARLLNGASFMCVVALTWVVLHRHTRSPAILWGATAFIAVSQAMLNVADHAWSEPLFCVLILLFTLVLEDAVTRRREGATLNVGAGLVVGCAFLVRYAAVILIVVGIVVLVTLFRRCGIRVLMSRVGVFLVSASILPAIWILRNAGSGAPYLLGPRLSSPTSIGTLTRLFTTSYASLFLPDFSTRSVILLILSTTPLLLGLAVLFRTDNRRRGCGRTLLPTATFVCLYPIFVVVSGKLSGSSIDTRLVAPMFPSAVIIIAVLLDEVIVGAPERKRASGSRSIQSVIRFGLLGVGSIVLIASVVLFVEKIDDDGATAHAYASPSFARSELAAFVRALRPGSMVATNRPWALYVGTGRQPIVPSPAPLYPSASLVPTTVDMLTDQACSRRVYLAWFDHPVATPPSPRVSGLRLHLLREADDGALFRIDGDPACRA